MNYAIIENESVSRNLEYIADWLREKDESISPKNRKRLDKLEKKIAGVLKKGFKFIPTKKRVKMLEEQKKRIEESEECFKTDRKQLEKQFTL